MTVTRLRSEGLVTRAQIVALVGRPNDVIVTGLLEEVDAVLPSYGIATPLRLAHFMAQIAHESCGFTRLWEHMDYSPRRICEVFGKGRHSAAVTPEEAALLAHQPQALAERVYGLRNPKMARKLGNRQDGDGWAFRGCGLIQLTGRANHERYAAKVGGPIADHPLAVAAAFWVDRGCNALADANDLRAITKAINGGTNGLADREALFRRAWDIWGDHRRAGERSLATVRDVKAAGSTIAKGADDVGNTAKLATGLGAAGAVKEAVAPAGEPSVDLLARVKEITSEVNGIKSVIVAAADTLEWMLKHWWIGVIVGGVYLYLKHRKLLLSRLKNFRLDSA